MRSLPLILVLIVAIGCGDSAADTSLGPTETDVTGTFNLQVSNGQLLPIIAGYTADGSSEIDMTADQLTIAADDTWTETTSFQVTSLADQTTTSDASTSVGTYYIGSNKINFVMTSPGTSTFTGSVKGDTLFMLYNGGRLTYTR